MNVSESNQRQTIVTTEALRTAVLEAVNSQRVTDIHTHLFSPPFGELLLWGIDELLTYHYLIAEVFRKSDVSYPRFWAMTKAEQADLIWQTLFIENSPISEACRGVVTTLNELGLDVSSRKLQDYRDYFADMTVEAFIDTVFERSKVSKVVMTNDPFDPAEGPSGSQGIPAMPALRRHCGWMGLSIPIKRPVMIASGISVMTWIRRSHHKRAIKRSVDF